VTYESEYKETKVKIEVQVELDDGKRLLGFLFVKQAQRLSDLLNDERRFLPLLTSEGLLVQLKKAAIARVTQLDQAAERAALTDPYEILGVSPRIDDGGLRKAYHALCAQHHPDKLVSIGLAREYIDMANSRIARIIDAYHRVHKLRQAAAAEAAKAAEAAAEAARAAEAAARAQARDQEPVFQAL
jgi:hypothetical protein